MNNQLKNEKYWRSFFWFSEPFPLTYDHSIQCILLLQYLLFYTLYFDFNKDILVFPLWHNSTGSVSAAQGHKFDPWFSIAGERIQHWCILDLIPGPGGTPYATRQPRKRKKKKKKLSFSSSRSVLSNRNIMEATYFLSSSSHIKK